MDIKKVCVIGAGVMGSGIAQISTQAGYETNLVDINDEILNKGLENIKKSLLKFVEKGKITQEGMDETLGRIKLTTSRKEGVKDVDLVIEAVSEIKDIKKDVFLDIDKICPEHTIFASNTSTIPISLLSSFTGRPDKVIGIHFMNPVPLMKGVEVIKSLVTSKETLNISLKFVSSLDKEPVVVKDSPGFITNRIMPLFLNEAVKLYEDGLATIEGMDKITKLSFNWPMGPFQLIDLVGIDIVHDMLESVYQETGWERYKPAPLLKRMKEVGWLGRKSNKGFYTYSK